MKRTRLLDSFAMIAYLSREKGYDLVKSEMAKAQETGNKVLMNEINVGETYYIIFRKRGGKEADFFINTILPSLPIETVSNDYLDVLGAARIKAEHKLSYADCFAVHAARKYNAVIITGDPEFRAVEDLVKIIWINK